MTPTQKNNWREMFEARKHIDRAAELSECGRYRWWLRRSWRFWDPNGESVPGKGVCTFIMLNPSTADARQDDPTIRRCIRFAQSWRYDTLVVRNLFPWRVTDPKQLQNLDEPTATGGDRGNIEVLAAATADLVVVAWGANVPWGRDSAVLSMFREAFPEKPLYCLGVTKSGRPRHPLYVRSTADPVSFTGR